MFYNSELRFVKSSKKDEVDSLGSIVPIKEADARMFQSRADDARGEAGSLRQLARLKSQKLEEEYSEKLSKLCLRKTEKLEVLQTLENAHRDYYKMKMRMHMEIAGLLRRMEAAKQLLEVTGSRRVNSLLQKCKVTLWSDSSSDAHSWSFRALSCCLVGELLLVFGIPSSYNVWFHLLFSI